MLSSPVSLSPAAPTAPTDGHRLLLIYTGGTIGMRLLDDVLVPAPASEITGHLRHLKEETTSLDLCSFEEPLDSASMLPLHWQALAHCVARYYDAYAGFVIIHGTDTMAYTAAALSFMLEHLSKPVILTGAQYPVSDSRSDALTNLKGAIKVASSTYKGHARVQEVAIFFGGQLFRGNRVTKHSTNDPMPYRSYNYPLLAEACPAGITYYEESLFRPSADKLNLQTELESEVGVLSIFPSLSESFMRSVIKGPTLKGLVLRTYGLGNLIESDWLHACLEEAIHKGIHIITISQCPSGQTQSNRYRSGAKVCAPHSFNLVDGRDMTLESSIAKLMCGLGRRKNTNELRKYMNQSVCGEISV